MNPVKIDTAAMPKIEVKVLCSTILEAVEAFYKDPKNLITGHRRPCGFGAACTVKETQGRRMRSGGMSQEVEAKVTQLYAQGYSDPSIAQVVGMTSTMIRYWRQRNELPPNAHGGRPRKDRTTEAKKKAAPRAGTSKDGK